MNTAASNADRAYNDNLSTRGNIASNADSAAIGAFNAGSNANYNAGQLGISQQGANLATANAQDASTRNNAVTNFNLATTADNAKYGRIGAQGGMMQDLQSTGQNRLAGGLSANTNISNADASSIQSILSNTAGIDQMDETQINAILAKAGVSMELRNSIVSDIKSGVSAGAALAKAVG
jgi:hypothetical protein